MSTLSSLWLSGSIHQVSIEPLPFTWITPRLVRRMAGFCSSTSSAVRAEHCTIPGTPVDSMREAVLTVSPRRVYFGCVLPTTQAMHGPECSPARSWTEPRVGSSSSMSVSAAARTASRAKRASIAAWLRAWTETAVEWGWRSRRQKCTWMNINFFIIYQMHFFSTSTQVLGFRF